MDILNELARRLDPLGLTRRGGFYPDPGDDAPPQCQTLVLIGNTGSNLWRAFAPDIPQSNNPLDQWTKAKLDPVANALGARAIYSFEGPPYWPFLRWANRAQELKQSPLGMLIDPEHGLWHAYRAAFAFAEKLNLPDRIETPDLCAQCAEKPCLNSCPVNAFTSQGYNVPACAEFLRDTQGQGCMSKGCQARRACPVGRQSRYDPAHAEFHMQAFLRARSEE